MPEHTTTIRAQCIAERSEPKSDNPRFEILFIRQGEANGWTFSPQVLKDSVPLWEGCSVFVDHAPFGRSVRDLGGVLSSVGFSRELDGLTATLTPLGPSKEIVIEAASFMLKANSQQLKASPDVGFSADVIFTADSGNNVQKIMQPLSVDLVIDPAFATRFIRQLNAKRVHVGARHVVPGKENAPMTVTIPADESAMRELSRAAALEAGRQLVELKLRNADLPAPAEAEIRSRFSGKSFDPQELDLAVNTWKSALAETQVADEIQGPRRLTGMFDSRDQLQAAIDDLIGAPREKGAENLKVARFQGIKEAYIHLTGDRDFVGGYFADRLQFQHSTASFPALVANSLNKALEREWNQLGRAGYDWWQKIATVEHFNTLNDITWMLFGTIGSLPTIESGAEYTELKVGDSHEHSSFVKRGGYIGITLEALDRDDTRALRAIPRELANAGLREISSAVAAIFTSASGAGPTLSDGGALFNSTAVATVGGHANLLTTALGTDYTAWSAVALAMFNQPMLVSSEAGYQGTGKKVALWPNYCLVPVALKAQADALFMPRWQSEVDAIASAGGPTWGGRVEVLTVPEWTDATDWAAAQDPLLMPGIMIGERFGLLPQIFVAGNETDPAMFSNDESRIKVRHLLAVGVSDFRPLHKSNVA